MAFTQDFTAPDGTKWTALGFTQLQGTADDAQTFNNRISRVATGGGLLFYSPTQDTGSDGAQTVKLDRPKAARLGLCVYASVTNNLLTAYYLRLQTSLTQARLYKIVNGGTAVQLVASDGIPDGVGLELRVSKNGSNQPVLQMFRQGVAISAPYTDTTSPILSGRRGLAFLDSNSMQGDDSGDNYEDNSVAAGGGGDPDPNITFSFDERDAGFPFDSLRGPATVSITGTYTGTPTAIHARIVGADGVAVEDFDWAVQDASPSGGTFSLTFDGPPDSAQYYVEVDDGSGSYITRNANHFRVNPVIIIGPEQSQGQFFLGNGKGDLAPSTEAVALVNLLRAVDRDGRFSREAEFVPMSTDVGSGCVAAANYLAANYGGPVTLVGLAASGTSVQNWLNDAVINAGLSDWTTYSGYATTILTKLEGQATDCINFWGTAPISREETTPGSYAADIELLMAKLSTDFFGGNRLHLTMLPHPRSNDDEQENGKNWRIRNNQYQFATSGDPNFSFGGWLLDAVMDGNGSPHQATDGKPSALTNAGELGNERYGRYVGHYIWAILDNSVPRFGPQITVARFTDANKTAIELVYDKDIRTPSGKTTGLPQFYVSTDNWATTSNLIYETTGDITGPRTVRITNPGGNWQGQTVKVDYIRSTPWDTTSGRYGGEVAVATLVDDLLYDDYPLNFGRGLPAAPVMGEGITVQDAGAVAPPIVITPGSTVTFTSKSELIAANLSLPSGNYTLDGTQDPPELRYVDGNGLTQGFNIEIITQ